MSKSMKISFIMISLLLGATVASGIWFVKFAMSVQEPVMDDAYFAKGLNYQNRVASLERAKAQGFAIATSLPANGPMARSRQQLTFTVSGKTPIENAALHIVIERPATTRERKTIDLSFAQSAKISETERKFQTEVDFPGSGLWEISAEAAVNKDMAVYTRQTVTVQ